MQHDDLARQVFQEWDRGRSGLDRLTFLNSGGRSRLMPVGPVGEVNKALSPVIHKAIATAFTTAAHDYAKGVYGARKNWPTHIHIDRPTS